MPYKVSSTARSSTLSSVPSLTIYSGEYVRYNTDYKTNYAWRSELRYTYQTEQMVVTGSATHTLLTIGLTYYPWR